MKLIYCLLKKAQTKSQHILGAVCSTEDKLKQRTEAASTMLFKNIIQQLMWIH